MLLKNLFLGLVGIAAVGGIGYGIYSSSQSNDEDKKDDESKLKDQADNERDDKSIVPKVEGDDKVIESDILGDGEDTNNNPPSSPSSPQ